MAIRAGDGLREVVVSAGSQRVSSAMTLLVMLGAAVTVIVTAGGNAAAQEAVLSRLDAAGTRTLTLYATGDQPAFTADLVRRLAAYDVVQDVVGLGPVTDVTAAANPDGTNVGMRDVYGSFAGIPLVPAPSIAGLGQVAANSDALLVLGMPQGRGSVRSVDGPEWLLTREIELPDYLADSGPTVLHAAEPRADAKLASLVVVADRPQDLPLVTELVTAELADVPRDGVTMESSQQLADLRAVIGGELIARSRGVVLGVLAAAVGATLLIAWSLALMRRRDFGRRRALGATRTMIIALMVGQVLLLGAVGALLGAAIGLGLQLVRGQPTPPASFVAALTVGLTFTAAMVTALPAGWAAGRDPLRELRVP